MDLWIGILIGSVAVFSWKIFGYLVPHTVLDHPKISKLANLLTVALLAGLTGVQLITNGSQIEFDARIPAIVVAAILLAARAPFIVMVAVAAAVAAAIRFLT